MAISAESPPILESNMTVGTTHILPFAELAPNSRKLISDSTVLRISNALQSSLYIKDVIHEFASESRRVLRKLSLRYRNNAEGLALHEGRSQLHRCTYEMNLLGRSLGELTFMRATPFTNDDLALLEIMLCALVYPLRNALLYERALRTALKDPLTGINNRASMEQHLSHQVMVAARHGTPLTVLMIDVDLFKTVNDTYGHIVGDLVLTSIADGIVKCTRNSDIVFRYGGEEFVVVLTNTNTAGAQLLAERVRSAVEAMEIDASGVKVAVTLSIGIAHWEPGDGSVDLMERADKMLYRAKMRGRNQVISSAG